VEKIKDIFGKNHNKMIADKLEQNYSTFEDPNNTIVFTKKSRTFKVHKCMLVNGSGCFVFIYAL
jgi:hypothetical protein